MHQICSPASFEAGLFYCPLSGCPIGTDIWCIWSNIATDSKQDFSISFSKEKDVVIMNARQKELPRAT